VLDALGVHERVQIHRALALALNTRDDVDPETLLVHFREGGLLDRARELVQQAAEKSNQALAFDRAAELWQEALSLGGWDELESRSIATARAESLTRAGRGAAAAPIFLSLAEGQQRAVALELRRRAGEELLMSGEIDRGTREMKLVLAAVGLGLPSSLLGLAVSIVTKTLWLALRGWRFSPREERDLPAGEALKLDICLSCSKVFSTTDVLEGLHFSLTGAILALRLRSRFHVAIARMAQGLNTVAKSPQRVDDALSAMEQAAASGAGSSRAHELVQFATLGRGMALTLGGRWARSRACFDELLEDQRQGGTTLQWDRDTAMQFSIVGRARLGRYTEVATRLPLYVQDALNRGDLYLSTMLRVGGGSILWLVRDSTREGRADVESALDRWGRTSFDIVQWWGRYSLLTFTLYEGDYRAAFEQITSLVGAMRWSRIRAVQSMWCITQLMVSHADVAALSTTPADHDLRRRTRSCLKRAAALAPPFWRPLLHLNQAGFEVLQGHQDRCLDALALAHQTALEHDFAQVAAFARIRRGQLIGGDEGAALLEQGRATLVSQGVVSPTRFVQSLSPGFAPANLDAGPPGTAPDAYATTVRGEGPFGATWTTQ
jgi:eukaryotic-like serine/threonine-protein kinase